MSFQEHKTLDTQSAMGILKLAIEQLSLAIVLLEIRTWQPFERAEQRA